MFENLVREVGYCHYYLIFHLLSASEQVINHSPSVYYSNSAKQKALQTIVHIVAQEIITIV